MCVHMCMCESGGVGACVCVHVGGSIWGGAMTDIFFPHLDLLCWVWGQNLWYCSPPKLPPIHAHTHTHTHTWIHTHITLHSLTHSDIHTHITLHSLTHSAIHAHTAPPLTRTCTYANTSHTHFTHINLHSHTHSTHSHIHTHAHTVTCTA